MAELALSAAQLHILQRALGLDRYGQGRSYRAHFVTGPRTDDWPRLRALVDLGMVVESRVSWCGGDSVFEVTDAGRRAVREQSPDPPKLTRSQRKYRRWLSLDLGMTFREFLLSDRAKEA